MKRAPAVALCLLGLGLVLGSVRGGEGKEVTITNLDDKGKERPDGGKVKLARGSILIVKLPGNPTTGFRWTTAKNDKEALSPVGETEYEPAKKGAVGSGGQFTLRFRAEKSGQTDLEFAYKRPFEKNKEPAKTFKLKVDVD